MIVKVIIKRDVIAGMEKVFFSQLRNLRFHAMDQEGYISGETLIGTENTRKIAVISTWGSLEDWNAWKMNEKRMGLDAELNAFQEKPAVYESYVFSKFKAAAEQGFPPPLQKMDL